MQELFSILIAVGLYIFFCYCFKLICQKAGKDPGILIWIPVLQMFPLLEVAELSAWTFLLLLVPVVNIVFLIIMWVKICQAIGKNPWLAILLFVPIINVFFIPYLAFSNNLTQSANNLAPSGNNVIQSELPKAMEKGAMPAPSSK